MQISKNMPSNSNLSQAIVMRKKRIGITIDNIALISNTKKSIVLKILDGQSVPKKDIVATTKILGLSAIGKSIDNVNTVKKRRAREKAIKIVSMVQGTSALEEQGIEPTRLKRMIVKTEKEFLEGSYKSKLWK